MLFFALLLVLILWFVWGNNKKTSGTINGHRFNTILLKNIPGVVRVELEKYCTSPEKCDTSNLPRYFDSREKWGSLICEAMNQEHCGSCWAFATATCISDRIRIHSTIGKNKISYDSENSIWEEEVMESSYQKPLMDHVPSKDNQVILDSVSPYTLAGCDICELASHMDPKIAEYFGDLCNNCCDGGVLQYAGIYMLLNGCQAISGDDNPGDYTCSDYTGSPIFRVKGIYNLSGEKEIMTDIMNNGPVICGFSVKDTFGTNRGLIPNTHVYGEYGSDIGGHAVCIIGWGEEKGTKYWLCRNSWGNTWNGDGTFKIQRGTCGIEDDVWGFIPFKVYDLTPGERQKRPERLNTCENQDVSGVVNPF